MSYVLVLTPTVVWLLFSAQFGSTKEFYVVPSNGDVEKCQAGHEQECHILAFWVGGGGGGGGPGGWDFCTLLGPCIIILQCIINSWSKSSKLHVIDLGSFFFQLTMSQTGTL